MYVHITSDMFLFRIHDFCNHIMWPYNISFKMVEVNLQNSLKIFNGEWWQIFTQPLAVFFLVLAFLGLCGPQIFAAITKSRKS